MKRVIPSLLLFDSFAQPIVVDPLLRSAQLPGGTLLSLRMLLFADLVLIGRLEVVVQVHLLPGVAHVEVHVVEGLPDLLIHLLLQVCLSLFILLDHLVHSEVTFPFIRFWIHLFY